LQPKRATNSDDSTIPNDAAPILAAETLRNAANNSEVQLHHAGDGGKPHEEKVPILWRILGGTILSIVALVVITAYQSLTGTLKDLQGEISQLKEAKADLVKKEDFAATRTKIWERFQTDQSSHNQQNQTITATLSTVKGDLSRSDEVLRAELARLNESVKGLQGEKREILTTTQAAVGQVRDRQATFEQQLRSAEQSLKAVEQQFKAVEQCAKDIQAANVAVSALQAATASREAQTKHADEHRAELAKAVAELRERLTRLEVSLQSKPPSVPMPAAKPNPKPPSVPAKAEEDPDGQ
jgi:hypothetical protein